MNKGIKYFTYHIHAQKNLMEIYDNVEPKSNKIVAMQLHNNSTYDHQA